MKIEYFDDYGDMIYEEYNVSLVPRVGDIVYFDEVAFVKYVCWYPKLERIRVDITESQISHTKVAEKPQREVKLADVQEAQKTADKALREANASKRGLSGIRQFLRTQKAPTKNDT